MISRNTGSLPTACRDSGRRRKGEGIGGLTPDRSRGCLSPRFCGDSGRRGKQIVQIYQVRCRIRFLIVQGEFGKILGVVQRKVCFLTV